MVSAKRRERGTRPRRGEAPPDAPSRLRIERRIGSDRHCRADGGVGWNDLTGFQRDLLTTIRLCAQEERIPTGRTIKDHLEVQYGKDINNGRLYQNLGYLVECGLVEKGFVDGRTNTYSLAPTAVAMLDETVHDLASICGIPVPAPQG